MPLGRCLLGTIALTLAAAGCHGKIVAGAPADGSSDEPEAGVPVDGGGGELDAGVPIDGGGELDVGVPIDGGGELDAGVPIDGGGELDAGVAADGSAPDAGPPTCTGDVQIPLGADIQQYLNDHPTGTSFCLAAGTYRVTATLTPKQDQRIAGVAGSTILSGARVLTGWTEDSANARWFHAGDTPTQPSFFTCPMGSSCCYDGSDACMYPDDVFRDNVLLTRVLSLSALAPGKVYVDYAANRIYVKDDPTTATMELTATPILFNDGPTGVQLSDFIVEKFGSNWAVVSAPAVRLLTGWVVDNVEARWNHGDGFHLGGGHSGMVLKNSRTHHNGQNGLAVSGATNAQILNCEIAYNNTMGFNSNWGAGAFKIAVSSDVLVKDCYSHHNNGQGMWTDIDNIRITYDHNTVEDNQATYGEANGIMHEISYDAVIKNNIVRYNDTRGIYISSSGGVGTGIVDVFGNTIEKNGLAGIELIQDSRGSGSSGTYLVRNVKVHDNTFTGCEVGHGIASGYQYAGSPGDLWNAGNTFEANHYHVSPSPTQWWQWEGASLTWSQWNGYGLDTGGTMATDAVCP
jgi:hypothetical protein